MKLQVGVIGLGDHWETRYRPALTALADRFEVRAIYAPVARLAENAARQWGGETVDGFRTLTSREDIDAVLVLGRQWCGVLPVLAACEAGKAVYCAADFDLDLPQAAAVCDRVDRSGVAFMAELPRRYAPATVRLKELIATHLGPAQLLFCHQRVPAAPRRDTAATGRAASVATRNLVELIDWCCYVVGRAPTAAIGVQHPGDGNSAALDYEMLSLQFAPGAPSDSEALAQISCGRYMPDSWPEAIAFRPPAQLQVSCERGVAFADLPTSLVWFDDAGRHVESLDDERPLGEQMLMQFHRAVTSLVLKTSGLADTYRALKILSSARDGFREGRRMTL
jgi:predicted dehydrogenase